MTDTDHTQDGIHEMKRVAKLFTMYALMQPKSIAFRFLLAVNGYWPLDLPIRQVMTTRILDDGHRRRITLFCNRPWHCGI